MPLAAGLLKAQLDSIPEINSKLNVSFMDFYTNTSSESISESICHEMPDLIGFSVYLWNRQLTEEVCHLIKKRLPETLLFAGGAEATARPENLLFSAPFDFVVKGEGELPLTEVMKRILKNMLYNNIPGVFIKNETSIIAEDQWPLPPLDLLPSPFMTGIINIENYSGILWELSRGCPFKCSFCFESRGVSGIRQISMDRLQRELEIFEFKKVNQVFVLDPTFNQDIKRAKKILRIIQKTAPLIHYTFELRTEFIDNEIAGLFASLNCSLQIGLQSAIPEVLSNVNRNIDPDKYKEKISILNMKGAVFGLDLIYGLPGDTFEGFKYSLNFALSLQPNHLDIFPLSVLPGTVLYEKADSFNLKFLHESPYTLISSPGFSESDMDAADQLKNSCNIFYNKGGAAGWMFMITETLGYKPVKLLEDFSKYIHPGITETGLTEISITELQLTFIEELFRKHNIMHLFPVMKDIINIHGALNRSLYAGPYTETITPSLNDESLYKLSSGTIFITLSYNFDDLMAVGEFTLEEFLAHYHPETTSVIIYNCRGVVKSIIVNRNIYNLLQNFTGELTLNKISDKKSQISTEEAHEFIEYAITETMIHLI